MPDLRDQRPFRGSARGRSRPASPPCSPFRCATTTGQLGALDLYRDTPGALTRRRHGGGADAGRRDRGLSGQRTGPVRAAGPSEQFHSSSLHDPLTGLPNRLLLLERLEHAFLRSRRSRHPVAILFVDLDRFKVVNDTHGHLIGDELLIAVADRMASLIRPGDTLARLSGDEFVILCEAISEKLQIDLIAQRIVRGAGVPVPARRRRGGAVGQRRHRLLRPEDDDDPEQLLQRGRHRHVPGQAPGRRHAPGRRRTGAGPGRTDGRAPARPAAGRSSGASSAPSTSRSSRTSDGRILGVEALLRWDHPTHGLIPPTTLDPAGRADRGSSSTSGAGCSSGPAPTCTAGAAATGGRRPFGMSVNVSAHQLMAPDFVGHVAEVLDADTARRAARSHPEITESVFIQDPKRALLVLDRPQGPRRAPRPRRLRHRVLVAQLISSSSRSTSSRSTGSSPPTSSTTTASHAIVTKIIELAHVLDLSVVTEGVETARSATRRTAMGSECYQGYYFARPMSAESLDELMIEVGAADRLTPPGRRSTPDPPHGPRWPTPGGMCGPTFDCPKVEALENGRRARGSAPLVSASNMLLAE